MAAPEPHHPTYLESISIFRLLLHDCHALHNLLCFHPCFAPKLPQPGPPPLQEDLLALVPAPSAWCCSSRPFGFGFGSLLVFVHKAQRQKKAPRLLVVKLSSRFAPARVAHSRSPTPAAAATTHIAKEPGPSTSVAIDGRSGAQPRCTPHHGRPPHDHQTCPSRPRQVALWC